MMLIWSLFSLALLQVVSGQGGCTTPAFLAGSGTFQSANPYADNQKCRWIITQDSGKSIELSFPGRFDIEQSGNCEYDAVVVYDSDIAAEVLTGSPCTRSTGHIGKFCGFDRPEAIVSSGNRLVVEFCSDSSSTGTGFEAAYKEGGPVVPPPVGSTCSDDAVVNGSYTVTYYSDTELPNFLDCNYKYTSLNGKQLKVTAQRFNLEGIIGCRYDSVHIYDGPSPSSRLLGTFCGVNGPKAVRTTHDTVYITLKSDEYTNGKGISLLIEETCGGQHLCGAKNVDGQDECYTDAQTCDNLAQCSNGQDESFCAADCGAFPDWVAGEPFPGAAAITGIDGQIHCGGALINNQYVLTAAHCFHRLDDKPQRFVVKLGAARLADAFVANIESVLIHPQWEPKTLAHNLAILKLTAPVPLQKNIAPFCHPSAPEVATLPQGTVCYTLGWGRTNAQGINSYATSVKQFTATVVANSGCQTSGGPVTIDNTHICASTSGNLCYGDNGAPLVCRDNNGNWAVSGINSIAYGCTTTPSTPAAFTKLSAYSNWIIANAFSI